MAPNNYNGDYVSVISTEEIDGLSPEMQKVLDRNDQMRSGITDADRWAYVRDRLVRVAADYAGGVRRWFLDSPKGRFNTFTEAIDAVIQEERRREPR